MNISLSNITLVCGSCGSLITKNHVKRTVYSLGRSLWSVGLSAGVRSSETSVWRHRMWLSVSVSHAITEQRPPLVGTVGQEDSVTEKIMTCPPLLLNSLQANAAIAIKKDSVPCIGYCWHPMESWRWNKSHCGDVRLLAIDNSLHVSEKLIKFGVGLHFVPLHCHSVTVYLIIAETLTEVISVRSDTTNQMEFWRWWGSLI